MSMTTPQRETLDRLLFALRDDELTDAQTAELECMASEHPEAMQRYLRVVNLNASLYWMAETLSEQDRDLANICRDDVTAISNDFSRQTSDPPYVSFTDATLPCSRQFVGGPVFSYMVATAVLCMMILGAWAYKITHHYNQFSNDPKSAPANVDPRYELVAQITGMKDCRWAKPSSGNLIGPYLSLGRELNLAAGLLEITYKTGAKVILEGPCSYKVDSSSGGYLERGKLTARVESAKPQAASNPKSPTPATLFSVTTPTAVVTDLGTEFGVEVGKDGDTVSHVFQGSVNVQTLPGNNGPSKHINLSEMQSARIIRNKGGVELNLVSDDSAAGDLRRDAKQNKSNLIAARFVRKMPSPSRRDPISSLSNPVSLGDIRIDGQFDDWKNIACYPDDPADDATSDPRTSVDLIRGAVAHDDENIYFFYEQANPTGILRYVPWIFLDTDLNRRTGRKQSRLEYPLRFVQSGNLRTGIDMKLEGGLLDTFPLPLGAEFNISGSSNLFVWDVAGLTKDRILDFGSEGLEYAVSDDKKLVEMRVPRRLVGNPDEFDLIWIAQNRAMSAEGEKGITDFYPDGAGDARSRTYFHYSTSDRDPHSSTHPVDRGNENK